MMEHKGIAADYGDEMGQYIANAPIDELNGTMDFYCKNWKSALGERLKNSILNFKEINKNMVYIKLIFIIIPKLKLCQIIFWI